MLPQIYQYRVAHWQKKTVLLVFYISFKNWQKTQCAYLHIHMHFIYSLIDIFELKSKLPRQ
ncbi:hypothetical protein SAMN05444280_11080 [Tangfeifania diversioriginum]|uniref:Uncharacterized protein n=1 Tax=Tangfeifania diversioriginum TaxID=1168035 RepID=A0A1M6G9A3_9BACT|nr:hypothetical protein SAMN05444280_11080 [Tangfeifania diversioriginum]